MKTWVETQALPASLYSSRSIITTVTSSVTGRPPQKAITRSISASTASPMGRSRRSLKASSSLSVPSSWSAGLRASKVPSV